MASKRCVKFLHERLMAFLKYYHKEDKGVLPFSFGKHLNKNLTVEELPFIPKVLMQQLKDRHS